MQFESEPYQRKDEHCWPDMLVLQLYVHTYIWTQNTYTDISHNHLHLEYLLFLYGYIASVFVIHSFNDKLSY